MKIEPLPLGEARYPPNTPNAALPQVTAVLVCWNHERFVREAVLSALQQTYPNVQLIVFDNGSTDGSRLQLEALAREHEFSCVFQENIGLVKTLNKAIGLATGKYFAILATDDVWLPDKIERQVRFLEGNPGVHMVSGNVEVIDENGARINRTSNFRPGEVTFAKLMRNDTGVLGPTVMCRTATLRSVGGYDEKLRVEDFAMALKFAQSGYRIVNANETFTRYRKHGRNWTSSPLLDETIEIGRAFCRTDDEYKLFIRSYLRGCFRLLAGRDNRKAVKLLCEQPIAWTWDDVGVGLCKLMIPPAVHVWRRKWRDAA